MGAPLSSSAAASPRKSSAKDPHGRTSSVATKTAKGVVTAATAKASPKANRNAVAKPLKAMVAKPAKVPTNRFTEALRLELAAATRLVDLKPVGQGLKKIARATDATTARKAAVAGGIVTPQGKISGRYK